MYQSGRPYRRFQLGIELRQMSLPRGLAPGSAGSGRTSDIWRMAARLTVPTADE